MAHTMTDCAREGYQGNENRHLYSSPNFYAHALGAYLHSTGRTLPHDVRMGRGDSIRANGMRFTFKARAAAQSLVFERIE